MREYPPTVALASLVTADAAFNDDLDIEYQDFIDMNTMVRLTDVAMSLTEVGQHSNVVVAASGVIAILRLDDITGKVDTWEDLLGRYRMQRRNLLGHARDAIRQGVDGTLARLPWTSEPVQSWSIPGAHPNHGDTCQASLGTAPELTSM
jgi:hypothetical protein